jgi:hypothetical protein
VWLSFATPPLRLQLTFWLTGRRLRHPYREWVARQLLSRAYRWRRLLAVLVIAQVFFLPSVLYAVSSGSWSPIIGPATFVAFMGTQAYVCARTPAVLAYYGVTADGQLVEPITYPQRIARPSLFASMVAAQSLVAVCALAYLVAP